MWDQATFCQKGKPRVLDSLPDKDNLADKNGSANEACEEKL